MCPQATEWAQIGQMNISSLPRKAFDAVEHPVSDAAESIMQTDSFMDALAADAVGDVRVPLADLGRVYRPAADPPLVQEPLDGVAVQQRREVDCVLRRRSGHRYV